MTVEVKTATEEFHGAGSDGGREEICHCYSPAWCDIGAITASACES